MTYPLLQCLEGLLAGSLGALELRPGGCRSVTLAPPFPPAALLVRSSGSTGTPKVVVLPVATLKASIAGTAAILGAHGQWLLALPPHYIAGALVVLRSISAGIAPVALPPGPFTAAAFTWAASRMEGRRRYTALVPTQLGRLVDEPAAVEALLGFDAVLVGGAPLGGRLLARCQALGVPLVLTYGSAESCGGCVYDGRPLPGVRVRIDVPSGQAPACGLAAPDQLASGGRGEPGRVVLGGPTIAYGYRDLGSTSSQDEEGGGTFSVREGTRWYRTPDIGYGGADGRLHIVGRADDVIMTGGLKVDASAVARALERLEGVREAYVVGVPNEQWGRCLAAVLTLEAHSPLRELDGRRREERIRVEAGSLLARHEVPKVVRVLEQLPLLSNGKVDGRASWGSCSRVNDPASRRLRFLLHWHDDDEVKYPMSVSFPPLSAWVAGARPRTLPMALCPVLVGSVAAYIQGGFVFFHALLALLVALALQVGVNYANDYSDGVRGTDNARIGPARLVASGAADAASVRLMALLCFAVAAAVGLGLVVLSGAWWFLFVGAACIAAAWAYTGGAHPYGYAGLGDVAVFIFFGPVATAGTTMTQAGAVNRESLLGGVSTGLIAVALLMVNNIRDIPTDAQAGKRTVAVRVGQRNARILYVVYLGVAILLPAVLAPAQPWVLLTLLMLPVALRPSMTVLSGAQGLHLIPVLQSTSVLNLGFSALYALGLLLSFS